MPSREEQACGRTEVLSNAQCVAGGSEVLVALVCTKEDSMVWRAEARSFRRKDT